MYDMYIQTYNIYKNTHIKLTFLGSPILTLNCPVTVVGLKANHHSTAVPSPSTGASVVDAGKGSVNGRLPSSKLPVLRFDGAGSWKFIPMTDFERSTGKKSDWMYMLQICKTYISIYVHIYMCIYMYIYIYIYIFKFKNTGT